MKRLCLLVIMAYLCISLVRISNADSATRGTQIVQLAKRQLGKPYVFGAASPRSGFDCSGLVKWVYKHVGFKLPHFARSQYEYGKRVARRALKRGDLLFFYRLGHVGIYIGGGKMIHASSAGGRVMVVRLSRYGGEFFGARRLLKTR